MPMTCVVLDDEYVSLELMLDYVSETPELELKASFNNPLEAIAFLKENPVDVVFLDMQMPQYGMTGIDVIEAVGSHLKYVLATANSEAAIEPYKPLLAGWLFKPFPIKRFHTIVQKLLAQQASSSS